MSKTFSLDAETLKRWRADLQFTDSVCGQSFTFRSTWGLFSPEAIDEGSRLMLELIKDEIGESDDCLDVGCGWGVLGMTLARLAPKGKTVMVDKDFVAVDYARRNAEANGLKNCETFLSNGFAQVGDRKFDIIVSNLPAKVSKEQHYLYLFDAYAHLKPGGKFIVVTINGLREFIARSFKEVFGNYDKLKQGKTYTVSVAVKE